MVVWAQRHLADKAAREVPEGAVAEVKAQELVLVLVLVFLLGVWKAAIR